MDCSTHPLHWRAVIEMTSSQASMQIMQLNQMLKSDSPDRDAASTTNLFKKEEINSTWRYKVRPTLTNLNGQGAAA